MAIRWRLKTYLSEKHGIYRATEFKKLIVQKTGVIVSLPNLCRYLNKKPTALCLATMEIFCSALGCELAAFCTVVPKKEKSTGEPRKLSFKNTPLSKRAGKSFPEPGDYE